jgi:hypothetical protein
MKIKQLEKKRLRQRKMQAKRDQEERQRVNPLLAINEILTNVVQSSIEWEHSFTDPKTGEKKTIGFMLKKEH